MFKNGKELLVHKGFMNLLTYTYVKSSEGSGWLASETRAHPNTVHHLICELQTLLVAILKLSSNNDVLVRMVKNNEEIPGVHANRIKKVCDNMYMLWSQRCLEPVSVFINAPDTYYWFPPLSGKKESTLIQQDQSGRPKQPKKDNPKRVKTAKDKEKESKGWLALSGTSKKLSYFGKVQDRKRLCKGWTFMGRYCGTDGCNRIHASSFDSLTPEFQKKVRIWVDDKTNKVRWAPGKEPKNSE